MVTLEVMAEFLAARLPKTVGTWDRGVLLNWVAFHWAQRSLAVVAHGQQVLGMGIAVRCEAPDMDDHWNRWNDRGSCLYVHQLAAVTPDALKALMAMMAQRVPDWQSLRIYGFRHDRRRRVSPQFFARTWRRRAITA